MLLTDLKYIAKFPLLEGVLKNFTVETDNTEYLSLKTEIEGLTTHSLIPEITDFICESVGKKLSDRIRTVNGFFLLFENGHIPVSAPDSNRIRNTQIQYIITIGSHWNSRNNDSMLEYIQVNKTLLLMRQLINIIKADDKLKCKEQRWLENAFQITPVEPSLLEQSIGWELTISKESKLIL